MNTQEAYEKLIKCIKGKDFQLKLQEEELTPFSPPIYSADAKLVINPKDNIGKFFAVPSGNWFGYVNNNPEDSFYVLGTKGKISQWELGVNASAGLKDLSYHWSVRQTTYDITNLVMMSQFTFLNWIKDNPLELKV